MTKIVEVYRDEETEMMKIVIDDKEFFEGNYWDSSASTWIDVMESAGLKVVEEDYDYDE